MCPYFVYNLTLVFYFQNQEDPMMYNMYNIIHIIILLYNITKYNIILMYKHSIICGKIVTQHIQVHLCSHHNAMR